HASRRHLYFNWGLTRLVYLFGAATVTSCDCRAAVRALDLAGMRGKLREDALADTLNVVGRLLTVRLAINRQLLRQDHRHQRLEGAVAAAVAAAVTTVDDEHLRHDVDTRLLHGG